jgi:hypothetical protein
VNPTTAPWATETSVARARELWAAGERVADIGRAVGASRDAICGWAHRHGWGPHPNQPIGGRKARQKPLAAPQKPVRRRSPPRPVPKPPAPVAAPVALLPPHRRCQWIESQRPLRMCGCPTVQHSSWCSDHQARVWVRPPRRLEAGL